jgi:hypothetical protein
MAIRGAEKTPVSSILAWSYRQPVLLTLLAWLHMSLLPSWHGLIYSAYAAGMAFHVPLLVLLVLLVLEEDTAFMLHVALLGRLEPWAVVVTIRLYLLPSIMSLQIGECLDI